MNKLQDIAAPRTKGTDHPCDRDNEERVSESRPPHLHQCSLCLGENGRTQDRGMKRGRGPGDLLRPTLTSAHTDSPLHVLPRKGSAVKRAEVMASLLLNLETSSLLSPRGRKRFGLEDWEGGACTRGEEPAGRPWVEVPARSPLCSLPNLPEHLSRPFGKDFLAQNNSRWFS